MRDEVLLAVGRLEGKVDLILKTTSSLDNRVVAAEDRITAVEQSVAVLEGRETRDSSWKAHLLMVALSVIAAAASLFGGYFNK